MYETRRFGATFWHPEDGAKAVHVTIGVGAKPLTSNPSEIGIQFLVCDPESDKPLAVLSMSLAEVSAGGGVQAAISLSERYASAVQSQVANVLNSVRQG